MTAVLDLSSLPAPTIVEALSFESILAALKADLTARFPGFDALELESEPATKLLEVCAYREMLLRTRVNDAAKAVMLAYAVGSDLDQIAARFEVARLAAESDADFRARIQQAYHRVAAAGPVGAYRAHALAAGTQVKDVAVSSPSEGSVRVCVLAHEWVAVSEVDPDEALLGAVAFPDVSAPAGYTTVVSHGSQGPLGAVALALSHEDVRPLTDHVVVAAPTLRPFEIRATLTLYPGPDTEPVLSAAAEGLDAYLASVRRITYDVTRAALVGALVVPGVHNVVLESPAEDLVAGETDLYLCTGVSLQAVEARQT